MASCKICGLSDLLKAKIEEKIAEGMGPTKICNAFPEADLNEGNVYTHKKHYRATQAAEAYDQMLEEKVQAKQKKEEAITSISEMPEEPSDSLPPIIPPAPEKAQLPVGIETMLKTGTTGNRVLDSVHVLDLIISQGEHLLETATLKDVMDAVRLKHQLLGDVEKPEDSAKKMDIQISQILVQLAKQDNLPQNQTIMVGEIIDDED